ncbi:unnamed protein product [Haemonchus placei]|uniref:CUB domain-containing protein n=1 Tax=Haemonchus placei TaxID=6290 RepID=A0A0N4WRC7_HAEPC|nr:unnamed protein product [Haemonchus placei]
MTWQLLFPDFWGCSMAISETPPRGMEAVGTQCSYYISTASIIGRKVIWKIENSFDGLSETAHTDPMARNVNIFFFAIHELSHFETRNLKVIFRTFHISFFQDEAISVLSCNNWDLAKATDYIFS